MTIRVLVADPLRHPVDLLVVGLTEGQPKLTGQPALVDKALGGIVSSLTKDEGFEGKERQTLLVQTHGKLGPKRVLVVGLGQRRAFTNATLREAAALAVKKAKEYAAKTIAFASGPSTRRGTAGQREGAAFVAEGALLGAYHYTTYHGDEQRTEHEKRRASELVLLAPTASVQRQLAAGVADGQRRAQATAFARDLVNTPASDMTPRHLVDVAKQVAGRTKRVALEVFDEAEIRRRGMGALLAVAKGSEEPPYFLHLTYRPPQKRARKVFLVGKGITFDSGGLSLKTAKYMESMKTDMAGAAAILGVFSALDAVQPRVELHGVMPVTENMPSGKATKPGDIARAMNGKTIEILNTDAEGRVILADGLSFAVQQHADLVVDLATLTGSCIEALGQEVAGLFSTSPRLGRDLKAAAEAAGEYLWEMPLVREYQPLIKSKAADLKNITGGGVGAGSITAALFLKEFVGTTPWAHLDIAGPAWAERETFASVPLGGTGFGVRTLLRWLSKVR
jgi:leucyl aminopeptidase